MKHTQGKARLQDDPFTLYVTCNETNICQMSVKDKYKSEYEANAELIAEVFNVTNECGFTPRQLLEQRNGLLEACKEAYRCLFDRIVVDFNKVTDEKNAEIMAYNKLKEFLLYNAINNATK